MIFRHVTISVRDMEKALGFYRDIVGLAEVRRLPMGGAGEIVFLGDGGTEVELIYRAAESELNYGQDISLGFQAESCEAMMATLREKGIEIQGGIIEPHPNTRFFFVRDPDGVRVQFIEG